MPTKSDPIWHYRQRGYREIKETPLFTDAIVRDLATKYGYPNPNDFQPLKETLERAAAIYWFWTDYRENAPRLSNIKSAISEIGEHAAALTRDLSRLDEITANLLWAPEREVDFLLGTTRESKSPYGHTIHRNREGDGSEFIARLTPDDILECVNVLDAYCKRAEKLIPRDPRGPRKNGGIRLWISSMAALWTEQFGKEFTYDGDRDNPKSEAACFCAEVLKTMDERGNWSRIKRPMQEWIKKNGPKDTKQK